MSKDRKIIYCVDDAVTTLTVVKNTLAAHYSVFTMSSGARLLNMLEKNIPDLILLDVEMPEMSGYEVIRIIKNNKKTEHIPIIFLTAKNDTESELTGLSLGAIDYITKPFSPPLLRKRIEVHLLVEAQKRELIHYNNNLLDMVETKTRAVVELQSAVLETIAELVESRDDITGGHIERTQRYLRVLLDASIKHGAYKEEISSWNIGLVLQSAQLHDVGKIVVSDTILQKPGKLTEKEFAKVKEHAEFGVKVIEKIKKSTTEHAFLEYASILAATHHEKWDGSGYPLGLQGEDIPLLGRLMAIADVYDALVSERPYKEAFTHREAVRIILAGRGTQFDPVLVDLFLSVSNEFYAIATSGEAGGHEGGAGI